MILLDENDADIKKDLLKKVVQHYVLALWALFCEPAKSETDFYFPRRIFVRYSKIFFSEMVGSVVANLLILPHNHYHC